MSKTGCWRTTYLIDGLLDLRFLCFSAGKNEISSQRAHNLQFLPQTVSLCFYGLSVRTDHLDLVSFSTC